MQFKSCQKEFVKHGKRTYNFLGRFYFYFLRFGGVFNKQLVHSRLLEMRWLIIINQSEREKSTIHYSLIEDILQFSKRTARVAKKIRRTINTIASIFR